MRGGKLAKEAHSKQAQPTKQAEIFTSSEVFQKIPAFAGFISGLKVRKTIQSADFVLCMACLAI